jgi:hypothetical protein
MTFFQQVLLISRHILSEEPAFPVFTENEPRVKLLPMDGIPQGKLYRR